jgi:hypothetical protein
VALKLADKVGDVFWGKFVGVRNIVTKTAYQEEQPSQQKDFFRKIHCHNYPVKSFDNFI